ncbi:PBSX family phage terminase large subunit [Chitinophaga polysaccharea]|uniref:PBSX family phage terminase large subunit n=1 Tax=Chitinophaga polysaccharea TaxID=1293035 RepID=A0A561PL52_9BACT|nr:terminase large subunit [Chitinophaga polysaccharea]TWF38843.1 PBSX family phage terminase large subunit [Chitinophaga polysaccharea]
MFQVGPLYEANLYAKEDTIVNQGGTSSGKTYSILQVLFTKAVQAPNLIITVVGQDMPNLKKGALRDAETILAASTELQQMVIQYNRTDRVFRFWNGSIIEFTSYLTPQDAKSGKRDYLFINEANGIPYLVYYELAMRTKRQVFIDYNPNAEFWVHTEIIPEPNTRLLISDHRHNPFCPQKIREKIEALRHKDYELFKVYGRGLTGKIEGLIFRNWFLVDEIPADATLVAYGLDFGFTNDETGLLGVWKQNGELWLRELCYETGLTNPAIARKAKEAGIQPWEEIVADSSEPKSIMEINNEGLLVMPALKGPDSVKSSIDIIKRWKLNVTKDSVNLRKELNTYKWKQDKNGKTINEPVDFMNHLIDPLRYVGLNHLANNNSGVYTLA